MNRILMGVALLAAAPLIAQPADAELIVAKVNGEVITRAALDQRWNRLGARGQQQYEQSGGGKAGFLDNYVSKRLLVQKAIATGFAKKVNLEGELDAVKEAALFDAYVREVLAAQVVTEADLRAFYDSKPEDFTYGERRYLRFLLVKTDRGMGPAREKLAPVFGELFTELGRTKAASLPPDEFGRKFSDYARRYSEDDSAAKGGEIGWFEKSKVDPKIADAVFQMNPGQMSGMLDGTAGLSLVYVEAVRPPEKEPFEQVRASIREYLLALNMGKIVEAVNKTSAALRASGKVALFPENLK